jgi:hypothetical protein
MIANWPRAVLAATVTLTAASPAFAGQEPSRLENSLTAGGLNIAPRYLDRPGDVDLNLLGGLMTYPESQASLAGGQASLQARLTERLVLMANMGSLTEIGLRGPIGDFSGVQLGWGAHYRSDVYFLAKQGPGRSAVAFGLAPSPGSAANGAEAKLNAMLPLGDLNLYASPLVAVMSNRSNLGAEFGADWSWQRLGLGYAFGWRANVLNPAQDLEAVSANELLHSVGARYSLTDRLYAQANYAFQPVDAYGLPSHAVLAGVGMRLLGARPRPVAPPLPPVVRAPEPEPVPAFVPESVVAAPVETEWNSLVGRVHSSLLVGETRGATVHLKRFDGEAWRNVEATATADAEGNFVFRRLPDGEYQVVYRDGAGRPLAADAAVASAVSVRDGRTAVSDLDVAWDEEAITGSITGRTVTVSWPGKPEGADAEFEVILKAEIDRPNIIGSPFSTGNSVAFEVSDEVAKLPRLYFAVKYWKRGEAFMGGAFYGQSAYKVLEVKPGLGGGERGE